MQILVLGSSMETAMSLDVKRLQSQINLCDRLLRKARNGCSGYSQRNVWWLQLFCNTLDFYRKGMIREAEEMSYLAEKYRPAEVTEEIIKKNQKYLAKKDPISYAQWQ